MIGEYLYYLFIYPLQQVLNFGLDWLFVLTHNYGLSVIALSLLVNLFLLKIFLYTDQKAQEESELKDLLDTRIKAWKHVYSRAKIYAFTRTLYRQHSYHPIYALRGLLGLGLQLPFFWAMYEVIKSASYLDGVSFLWIGDLKAPDSVEIFGFSMHILPLLMTFLTLINTLYSAKSLSAKIQGISIALLFLLLLYDMPSSLVLYWTCNMAFSLLKEVYKSQTKSNTKSSIDSNAQATSLVDSTIESTSLPKSSHLPIQAQRTSIALILSNLCLLACVFTPFGLYTSDLGSFDPAEIIPTLLSLCGFCLLASFVLVYVCNHIFPLPKLITKTLATLLLAVLLLALSYTFIFVGDYGAMSFFVFDHPVIATDTQKLIDYIAIPLAIVLAIVLSRFQHTIILANKILSIVLIVSALIYASKAVLYLQKHNTIKHYVSAHSHLLDFAKEHSNILVLILDRADGYTMHQILSDEQRTHFSGFIDFTNATSSNGSTLPTLTSVIAGEHYTAYNINSRNIQDTLQNEIARGYAGILNRFHQAGFDTRALLDFPTDPVHLYPLLDSTQNILFDSPYRWQYTTQESQALPLSQLLSFGIFRLSTFKLRRDIYQGGKWLFISAHLHTNWSTLRSISEIRALAKHTTANATAPTFTFIHNSITHNPYALDEKCSFDATDFSSPNDELYGLPQGHYNSEKCAILWITQMLDRLKELGVYDNTQIFITADHGAQGKHLPINRNYHIPLFYKPFNAKGKMIQDSRLIANYDIPRIYCANLKQGCPNVAPNILENYPARKEVITFDSKGWRFEHHKDNAFVLDNFSKVVGHIYELKNWHKLESKDSLPLQEDLSYKQSTDSTLVESINQSSGTHNSAHSAILDPNLEAKR
ncbi:membrane protein insertase YidC [Helicobacter sp.]|uniref:membrane protein insertase YidC n=1 Tax=Helicobacter sp. TaxID=218 RepID=UPI0025BE73C7|nr:membrane protein insertase YidC [Helicobacter sp.]MBR2494446.1 membrane protein insertase YidC [Helicobacter sp.]